MAAKGLQTLGLQMHPRRWGARIEAWLEAERDQLFLWTPVALGAGVAAWFVLLSPVEWLAFLGACAGVALFAAVAATGTRLRHVLLWAATLAAVGCGLSWWRAERVAAPVIARPIVAQLSGRVERVELLPAREIERLTLVDLGEGMPDRVRVSVALDPAPPAIHEGDRVNLRARLVAPQEAAVPGGYDFQRIAWFQQLGGVGKTLGPISVTPAERGGPSLRERLSAHIRAQIAGSAGGIASAFASGDRGGIAETDEEAMRASGLTHLRRPWRHCRDRRGGNAGERVDAFAVGFGATHFGSGRRGILPNATAARALAAAGVALAPGGDRRGRWGGGGDRLYAADRRRGADHSQLRRGGAGVRRHRAGARSFHATAGGSRSVCRAARLAGKPSRSQLSTQFCRHCHDRRAARISTGEVVVREAR